MLDFLEANWGNILVLSAVLAVAAAAVRSMVRRGRAGESGCGCSDCPSNGICHPKR